MDNIIHFPTNDGFDENKIRVEVGLKDLNVLLCSLAMMLAAGVVENEEDMKSFSDVYARSFAAGLGLDEGEIDDECRDWEGHFERFMDEEIDV